MLDIVWISSTTLTQCVLLSLAFVLSAIVGLERQRKLKSAGLRTHTLVGVGAAAYTLVSAYGFQSVTGPQAMVDPSRIAAQIVSGVGFLGAGVIFVRRNSVAGLTTAASIWLTASIGMACGAGAPMLAIMATALDLLAVWGLGKVGSRIRQKPLTIVLQVRYREGFGALRNTLSSATHAGFDALVTETRDITKNGKAPRFLATIALTAPVPIDPGRLVESLTDVHGVTSVQVERGDDD